MSKSAPPPPAGDPFDLRRFLVAQEHVYANALAELRAGYKRTHWMWYVFPQLDGLGRSAMAIRFAISGPAEAQAYLAHPALGPRLRECAAALLAIEGRSARDIMGPIDDMKLRSSATLFSLVAEPGSVFARLIERYFEAGPDGRTLQLLRDRR